MFLLILVSCWLAYGELTVNYVVFPMKIPKTFREAMKTAGLRIGRSQVHEIRKSRDGTVKFLLRLHDGLIVETVGIPADMAKKPRLTVCVSSQVRFKLY